jgi:putative transposase
MDHRIRAGRRRSFNEPGHAHELTFTCYRRFQFLAAERTCGWLAEAIESARAELDFAL